MTEQEFWAMGAPDAATATLTEDDFWSMGAADPSDPLAFGGIPQEELLPPTNPMLERMVAEEEARTAQGIDPYQYNLQRSAEMGLEADPRGLLTGNVVSRAAEGAVSNLANRVTSMYGGVLGAAADAVGLEGIAAEADLMRDVAQGQMSQEAVQQDILDKRGLLNETLAGWLQQGGAALGEAAAVGTVGKLPGLAAYYGLSSYDQALNDGASQAEAFTHGAIEGAFSFLGGKIIGAGTGALAQKLGGGAATETIGSKAADYIAKKFPIPRWVASATTGAAGEVVEEAATEVSHYLADVGFGREKWSKDRLLERVAGVVGPSAVAGLLGGGLANTIELLDRRYRAAEGVKTLVEKTTEDAPVTRGDLEKAGLKSSGTTAQSRKEIARQFIEGEVQNGQRPDGGVVQGQEILEVTQPADERVAQGEVLGDTGVTGLPSQRPQEIPEAAQEVASAPQPPAVEPVGGEPQKQPWEMTADEYLGSREPDQRFDPNEYRLRLEAEHGQLVKDAYERGEQIPPHVLESLAVPWAKDALEQQQPIGGDPNGRQILPPQQEDVGQQIQAQQGQQAQAVEGQTPGSVLEPSAPPPVPKAAARPTIYRQIDRDSIPKGLEVDTVAIDARTRQTVPQRKNARAALEQLEADDSFYKALIKCLQS